jgi:hypothetical protein
VIVVSVQNRMYANFPMLIQTQLKQQQLLGHQQNVEMGGHCLTKLNVATWLVNWTKIS